MVTRLRSLLCIFILSQWILSAYGQTFFTATLTGDQANPAVTSEATGTGVFMLSNAGLEFRITVEGLDIAAAHFHSGSIGINGGVVRNLAEDFDGRTATGIWTSTDSQPLTDEIMRELLLGNLYVNIHTAENPGGEIRGQVIPSSGTFFSARLTGDQENPPVTTEASGTGGFLLTDAGLIFSLTVEGLQVANAHFHNARIGENGGVVKGIASDFNGNTAFGIWTGSDEQPLSEEVIKDLLLGNLYVNIHTAENPGGEIRGQVLLGDGIAFSARLTGDQENPPVTTEASGTGVFTLTNAGLVYQLTVEGLSVANAHFHSAAPGENGGVVKGILEDFSNNTASGVWRSTDAQPLTKELIAELLKGNLYINIHTAENPGGEIRGQVLRNEGTSFSARLTGPQADPELATDASGTGTFMMTDSGLVYQITVHGLDVANAHFHGASIGSNGGVVRGILDSFVGNTASGIWRPTDADALSEERIADLLLGNLYINIHTAENPGGEIRGQVLLNGGTGMMAMLSGDQENPAIATDGSGTGTFVLTDEGLVYHVTVDEIDVANAHFHAGSIGVNGGVVRGIMQDFSGRTASGVWRPGDSSPLSDEIATDLITGQIYLNIHTAENPGGEIRGQVLTSGGWGFPAYLMGGQEVPSVTTEASGTGSFTLTNAGLLFHTTVEGLEIANAHLHNAPFGENGGVVRGILNDFTGLSAKGVWKNSDNQPLTSSLLAEIVSENIYVNIHTAENPGGEIRGQLGAFEITTSISEIDPDHIGAQSFELAQNTPNPFRLNTQIQYVLKDAGNVRLSVYSFDGKEIAVLVDDRQQAGEYSVHLDAERFDPGMYIYRMSFNGLIKTGKMIIQ